jgi:RecA-family ATPase
MEGRIDIMDALGHIDPAGLTYQEWVSVGMALKQEGRACGEWDGWSAGDPARYHPGECAEKWRSFNGAADPVAGGTIVEMARRGGYRPRRPDRALEWDDVIGPQDGRVVADPGWVEPMEVREPAEWDPARQLAAYLETLFEAGENVSYVIDSYERDGKRLPASKGNYDRTAGELVQALGRCNGDIGAAIGDTDREAGAWIRFNPVDGKGVRNENVTDFRYALVESDKLPPEQQSAIIRELELPVACLVHSGGKSIHAIVRIGAGSFDEYRKRVDYLYAVCKKNGLPVDTQNKNPSRLSRMPGVARGGRKQFLIGVNLGRPSFAEWKEWVESASDDLPDFENMAAFWDNLPALSPPLIEGVLRQGHKMLLAGPSKSGKSFALIELAIAIAEGREWIGFPCAKGRVLYINLEIDDASAKHRFVDVYRALGWPPDSIASIDLWGLRGKSLPIDQLAPKLIRRAQKKRYSAVIFDPIYKIITGDENSADQMAAFCNQFDKVCTQLGCSVVYCHHHSKGAQGHKRSMDRAAGSGVFARDPDALLDYMELSPTAEMLELHAPGSSRLPPGERPSALRIEGTLREFAPFRPVDCWFHHPIHKHDSAGVLAEAEGEQEPWRKAAEARREGARGRRATDRERFESAAANAAGGEPPAVQDVCDYLGVQPRTLREKAAQYGYYVKDGRVWKKPGGGGEGGG